MNYICGLGFSLQPNILARFRVLVAAIFQVATAHNFNPIERLGLLKGTEL
jgi:hypothetical protein